MVVAPELSILRSTVSVRKQRVTGSELQDPEDDVLAIEDPLEIRLADERKAKSAPLTVTMRTPGHDVELVAGFLFTESLIERAADILSWEFSQANPTTAPTRLTVQLRKGLDLSVAAFERNFIANSSCGVCGKTSLANLALSPSLKLRGRIPVPREFIHKLPALMRAQQPTFQQTGGLHAAALFAADGHCLVTREDIGRHNALDKAIGAGLISGFVPGAEGILFVSGRMSYEILQKALVARIPIVAGVGAPSSLAVALANDFGVTLLGFVRGGSYNIYSCPERLA